MYCILLIDETFLSEDLYKDIANKTNGAFYLEAVQKEEVYCIFKSIEQELGKENQPEKTTNLFLAEQAMAYIQGHYNMKITLSNVAEELFVSPCYLSKVVNKNFGKHFNDILNETRIYHAKHLLENPAFRIYDIAEMVGFSDVAHFSRVFRKVEGRSPNEYRNKNIRTHSVKYVLKLKKMLDFSEEKV